MVILVFHFSFSFIFFLAANGVIMTEPSGDVPEIYESRKLEAGNEAEPAEKARIDARQSEKSDLASSDEGDASYEMTEDQRQALLEMSMMRAEMGDYSGNLHERVRDLDIF